MALGSPIAIEPPQELSRNSLAGIDPGITLKQFEMLHSLLRELQRGLLRGTFATAGFILIGIAWFVSAKDSAPFLREHPHFIPIAAISPVLGSLLYCYASWLIHKRSQNTVAALRRFDFMPPEIFENQVVRRSQFFIFSGGIVLLCMILGACIYFAGHSSPDEDNTEDEVLIQIVLTHTHETRLLKRFDGLPGRANWNTSKQYATRTVTNNSI